MQVQKISNYGTATPWVPRVSLQAISILANCDVPREIASEVGAAMMKLHQRMSPLQKARDELWTQVETGRVAFEGAGAEFDWGRVGTAIPSIPDLQSIAEGFLQAAKIAVAATTEVIRPFYGQQFDHRFDKVARWGVQQFGATDAFVVNMRTCEVFVKQLLALRDAIEHPVGGRFVVSNLRIEHHEGKWWFGRPGWCVEGQTSTDMLSDMEIIIERVVEVSEIIVLEMFYKHPPKLPMIIEEVPPEDRDPKCPVRYIAIPEIDLKSLGLS